MLVVWQASEYASEVHLSIKSANHLVLFWSVVYAKLISVKHIKPRMYEARFFLEVFLKIVLHFAMLLSIQPHVAMLPSGQPLLCFRLCQISRMALFTRMFYWQGYAPTSDNCRIAV